MIRDPAGQIDQRMRIATVGAAALALLLPWMDRPLLGLLPGWQPLMRAFRGFDPLAPNTAEAVVEVLLSWLLVAAVLRLAYENPRKGGFAWLGLTSSLLPALRVIGAAVMPAYVVFALTQPVNRAVLGFDVLYLAFIGPFAEEVVFRGAAFGLLRRLARWPFWAAAGVPAAVFGLGHANPFQLPLSLDAVMTFLITATGAIVFSWLYERWRFNLWVPFFLHAFLNFAWSLFRVGDGAFAGWLPLVMQVTTVTLAILLTIRAGGRQAAAERADGTFP